MKQQPPPEAPAIEDKSFEAAPPMTDAAPEQAMGSLLAAQVALMRVVKAIEVHVGSFERLIVERGDYGPTKPIRINNITLDMPTADEEIQPLNATIIERADQIYDEDHRPYIRETWRGYPLRVLSKSRCSLGLVAWFGHKNDRRAFRTALARALLAEPMSERGSRVVVVPEYFDQTVRLVLDALGNGDEQGNPQANHWPLQATITAHVDEVEAVGMPATIKPSFKLQVG